MKQANKQANKQLANKVANNLDGKKNLENSSGGAENAGGDVDEKVACSSDIAIGKVLKLVQVNTHILSTNTLKTH